MNEQALMMNEQPPMVNPPPPGAMMGAMSQQPPPQLMNPQQSKPPRQMLMNPPPLPPLQQMMNRGGYGMWGPPQPLSQSMDLQLNFPNPNPNPMKALGGGGFCKPSSKHQLGPRNNWKGKKLNNKPDKRKDLGRRMMDNPLSMGVGGSSGNVGVMGMPGNNVGAIGGGFNPSILKDLQYQNRVKTRRYFQKNYYSNNNKNNNNMGKFAPRNTTSFIIRAKKSGGITELVSPCPVTPAVLPTPVFSPSREGLVDMAKEEWGVDGYGSMKGLIRLRSPGNDEGHEDEDDDEGGSSESDVEEHVEVERRLDHDLSRFKMIYPNYGTVGGVEHNNVLENRVDDQDTQIAQLEEENLILKERLFLMERELGDLRRRLHSLEGLSHGSDDMNEEVIENSSENESDSRGGAHSLEDNNDDVIEENVEAAYLDAKVKEEIVVHGNSDAIKTKENKAEIKGEEGTKGDMKVCAVEGNKQNHKNGHDSYEASENLGVGNVCIDEEVHNGKGFTEEIKSENEAAGSEAS